MRVVGFRAFYSGGRVFESGSSVWDTMPSSGVLAVMLFFDEFAAPGVPYRRIMQGDDIYYTTRTPDLSRDGTGFEQTNDPVQANRDATRAGSVKIGVQVSDAEYNATIDFAMRSNALPGPLPIQTPEPKGLIATIMGLFQ